MKKEKSRSILDLTCTEARAFLLKHESYCNTELPPYFQFGEMLRGVDKVLAGKSLSEFWNSRKQLRESEGVNYRILKNRDGRYQWRPLELIHPALSRLRKGGREGFVLVDSDAYRDVSWCRDFTATCGAST